MVIDKEKIESIIKELQGLAIKQAAEYQKTSNHYHQGISRGLRNAIVVIEKNTGLLQAGLQTLEEFKD